MRKGKEKGWNREKRYKQAMEKACEGATRREPNNKRRRVYWWTEEVATKRKECFVARRIFQRNRGKEREEETQEVYKTAKKNLKKAINETKREKWKKLCQQLDNDPWGQAYRIV